jgi:signal peptidase I
MQPTLRARKEKRTLEFRKSTIREYFEAIVTTAIVALFLVTFVVQAFKIPTGSMKSTLLIGDHLLVNKFVYGVKPGLFGKLLPYREPGRGDVIVFKYPNDPGMAYVKRLIGMPGDTVEMTGRTVFINGEKLGENYNVKKDEDGDTIETIVNDPEKKYEVQYFNPDGNRARWGPYTVPEGHYFAMGDNRDNSQDSRYGFFVPRDYMLGQPLVIYWSFETARDEYLRTSPGERIERITDVALNFFTKTNWKRIFTIIR